MMRAAITLIGLAYMGYHDWRRREFDDRPVLALAAASLVPTAAEYAAVYLVNPPYLLLWLAAAARSGC